MYNRILLPVDGSEGSSLSVNHCLGLIKGHRPQRITILHVATFPSQLEYSTFSGKLRATMKRVKEGLEEVGQEILVGVKNRFAEEYNDLTVETKMVWGDPKYEIVREAEEGGFDLVILGSRGLSGIKSIFIGSVSQHASQHAPCTVTIVKKGA